ncbi:MAG: DUF4153 domain-containing protein [Janthinobacterium lividum]
MGWGRGGMAAKVAGAAALVGLGEVIVDGGGLGAILGAFALAWLAILLLTRPTVIRAKNARIAAIAAVGFGLVMIDDPSLLAWAMFWTALSLAALLPRRRFDDAVAWAGRLGWHALAAVPAPVKDAARVALVRARSGRTSGGVRSLVALLALPVIGGTLFVALFAGANPLISDLFARIVLPDAWTVVWRSSLAMMILLSVWASLRPSRRTTAIAGAARQDAIAAPDLAVATLALSLLTFNVIFAVENALDIIFLWSGAALPAGVTMADYAHRGAYSLIVTALLAGAFVLVALRPGSAGAASSAVRRLVALWIAQNLLLVASSARRTLDYVDAYGMTVLRLSALAWMALVATGLALIGWRLLRDRSAAWLINANALAATLVLATASVVDLGATAAAWNVRVALERGPAGPPLDLCYMARLGSSSLVSLAVLERHVRQPGLRDRVAALHWQAQEKASVRQQDWRRWSGRDARRLATVRAMLGMTAPRLRPSPLGRDCDGSINTPPPAPAPAPTPAAAAPPTAPVLTQAPHQ